MSVAWWTSATMDFATTSTEVEDSRAVLYLPGPGGYRVRVHGRNRDDGDPRGAGDPVEEYLIQGLARTHKQPVGTKPPAGQPHPGGSERPRERSPPRESRHCGRLVASIPTSLMAPRRGR
jgi:hypothetical protein